jgi:hypothetical protein
MTSLDQRKSQLRFTTCCEVRERGKWRAVIIECSPAGMLCDVRLQGMRARFPISFETIYRTAQRIHAERVRAEKKAARKKK